MERWRTTLQGWSETTGTRRGACDVQLLHSNGRGPLLLLWAVRSLFLSSLNPSPSSCCKGFQDTIQLIPWAQDCENIIPERDLAKLVSYWQRPCCLPRQSVPQVSLPSLLQNLVLPSRNLSPLVLKAGEQFVPSILQLFLCVWKRLSCLPLSLLY